MIPGLSNSKEPEKNEPLTAQRGDSVYILYPSAGKQGAESDVQVHGLFQEDIEEGIRCGQCEYWANQRDALGRRAGSYEEVVMRVHGTSPHVVREQQQDKAHGLLRQILEKLGV